MSEDCFSNISTDAITTNTTYTTNTTDTTNTTITSADGISGWFVRLSGGNRNGGYGV